MRLIARYFALITEIGLTIVVTTLMGYYLGGWIDRRLDTGIVFMIIGVVFGLVSGFYSVYQLVAREMDRPER
ncbi:MAG: AtpZ/AtpI family protein [Firmicutes bacterium]|nr:AtpZ/AtpI family protein [Bacillota bacterium]